MRCLPKLQSMLFSLPEEKVRLAALLLTLVYYGLRDGEIRALARGAA